MQTMSGAADAARYVYLIPRVDVGMTRYGTLTKESAAHRDRHRKQICFLNIEHLTTSDSSSNLLPRNICSGVNLEVQWYD